jgi:hypothetical protein
MSTTPVVQPQAAVRLPEERREIKIISHSSLYYWWPVWAVGFILALITHFSGTVMAVVPASTRYGKQATGTVDVREPVPPSNATKLTLDQQDIFIGPKGKSLEQPLRRMSGSKNLGVLYALVLLLVIAITNIPLRGLWSVIVIVFIVFMVIILALLDVWEEILNTLNFLDIRINEGGYVLISSVLFVMWAIVVFLFDKQLYMVFTPGQLRVRLEIGEGETAYDTTGMTIQKQRSDLFRHWILGLGSGDLIVRTAGAQAHHFDLPNVLFLGRKVREIEEMLRSRQVVAGTPRA